MRHNEGIEVSLPLVSYQHYIPILSVNYRSIYIDAIKKQNQLQIRNSSYQKLIYQSNGTRVET